MLPLFMRSIKFVIGLGVVGVLLWALLWTVVDLVQNPPAKTAEHEFHHHPKPLKLASDGIFGRFDNAQLQRGFQVYKEVCATCHSLGLASFRELRGIGYTEAEVKKIAADWPKQPTFNPVTGDRGERINLLSDRFPHVYYSGVGVPPDLTLIAKARHGGGSYIYSLMTGYEANQPKALLEHFPDSKTGPGMFYNPYFANLNLSMPPPLTGEGQVTYVDGTRATVDQMAKDVSAFLVWTAEPTAQTRKQTGLAVVIFLIITTMLAYGAYLSVWRGVKH